MASARTNTRQKPPQSRIILEHLEFDIHEFDRQPLPSAAAYFLMDGQFRILEYDTLAAELLGIPEGESHFLSTCRLLSEPQRQAIVAQLHELFAGPQDSERFLRLELPRLGAMEAHCFTFRLHRSETGVTEAVGRIEPILSSRSSAEKAAAKTSLEGLQLWSLDESQARFELLAPLGSEQSETEWGSLSVESWIARVCEEDKERFRHGFLRFIGGESEAFHMRYRLRKTCGELKWISTIARRRHGPQLDGENAIIGLHRDEAEIPNSVNDLRLFSYLAKKVHLSIVVTNPEGEITWCNNAFTESTGYALEEIVHKTPGAVLQGPQSDPETIRYMRDRVKRGKAFHAEIVNYKRNGVPYWVRIDANPLVDEKGKVLRYIAFQTDITESKKNQRAAQRNEIKFRSLFDHSLDALLLVSQRDGIIFEANPAATRLFGEGRLIGRRLNEFFTDSDVCQVERLGALAERSEGASLESSEFVAQDGQRRPVEISVARIPIGDATALFVTLRDISEKRALEEQLRHAQRMEAVGRLAGGIAHDFNNLLAGLRGFSELLCNSRDLSKKDHVYANEVLKITDRASKLTSRLLSFSRGKSDRPVVASLNDIVSNLTPMLARILKKDIQFTSQLDPALGNVRVDPNQIEQVIMNLVMNGQEAISSAEGSLALDTRSVELSGSEIFITGKPRPGRYACVCVRDNGQGIPQSMLERIFEPFFTTKKGAGTGLGLSIVYGIIQSNGGHLMVDSHPGVGAEFSFYFPEVDEPVATVEPCDRQRRLPEVPSYREFTPTILVAEDQDQVREILELGLSQNGYDLLVAVDGKEAIELARSHGGAIDLLLTDSIMPRASGRDVVREVRKLHPKVRVVMMSGLPQCESGEARQTPIDAYVDKPFSIRKLLELIDSLLEQSVS